MKKIILSSMLAISLVFANNEVAICGAPQSNKKPCRVIEASKIKKKLFDTASWYGPGFYGQETASGKILRKKTVGAAHRTAPLGTKVKVTNLLNNKSVVVPVIDRGPFPKDSEGEFSRDIDLTHEAAKKIGMISEGLVPVKICFLHS